MSETTAVDPQITEGEPEVIRQLHITFKSGASITVDVTEFTIKYNGLGDLTTLEWKTPTTEHRRRLLRVELSEIVAIVEEM